MQHKAAAVAVCVRLQVELNTISSSFGCLCTLVGQMHRYIMEHQGASQQVMHLQLLTLTNSARA